MKPLIVLLAASLLIFIALKLIKGTKKHSQSARIGMSVMLIFTALGHFLYTDGMAMMIPDGIPYKIELVYITGVLEIFGAIGLQIPAFRKVTAWLLIIFFILMLPANINASIQHLNYQTGIFDGHGLDYLWFRIPLQLLFIGWVYCSAIKK
ncbi:hypothetical protein ACFO5O_05220 [Geojedonia litorea]|uniref:DoxX-like family protein n=1 Tax=Geojedonia litorea TaxID=1268269 RepID=A0ABV9N0F5_9FLAO